jgi:hypothetical protein
MARRRGLLMVGAALLAGTAAQILGRTAGSTRLERQRPLDGDDVVPNPSVVTDHAATIAAPPERVWPWLTQVGWHLAGWYTPRWVDRVFFPGNWSSLDHLDPDLVRALAVGDRIPDGPPGTAVFQVITLDAPNPRPALHHPRPGHMDRPLRREHRLDLVLPPRPPSGAGRQPGHSSTPAGTRARQTLVDQRRMRRAHHPFRLRHGPRHAAGPQATGRGGPASPFVRTRTVRRRRAIRRP